MSETKQSNPSDDIAAMRTPIDALTTSIDARKDDTSADGREASRYESLLRAKKVIAMRNAMLHLQLDRLTPDAERVDQWLAAQATKLTPSSKAKLSPAARAAVSKAAVGSGEVERGGI